MIVSVCIIATNRYKEYLPNLLFSIEQYFLLNHDIEVIVFSDIEFPNVLDGRVKIINHVIPPYPFPFATLYRYKIMLDYVKKEEYGDYIFYIDADSLIVAEVGDEILAPITAVLHPGYYRNGGGSWGNIQRSLSYTKPNNRLKYYAGGFQGGEKKEYYEIMQLLTGRILYDEKFGIMAEWQDETHWNRYLSETPIFLELTPDYMMPEPPKKRIDWGIDNFSPKILALEKPKGFRL